MDLIFQTSNMTLQKTRRKNMKEYFCNLEMGADFLSRLKQGGGQKMVIDWTTEK